MQLLCGQGQVCSGFNVNAQLDARILQHLQLRGHSCQVEVIFNNQVQGLEAVISNRGVHYAEDVCTQCQELVAGQGQLVCQNDALDIRQCGLAQVGLGQHGDGACLDAGAFEGG